MDTLKILTHPDSRLRQKARSIKEVTNEDIDFAKKMLETMYQNDGIGLAATQVNIQKRMVVIDISDEKNNPIYLFNPEILEKEGSVEYKEGCLSVPEVFEFVSRSEKIKYQSLNLKGDVIIESAEGLLAICIQHEIDHLDGKLFVDYLSIFKQRRILEKALEIDLKTKD